jgi:DNA helicase-2/ATP-dependent DNA helicase PcrA
MKLSGYKEFLSDGSFESEGRLENIEELMVGASNYESLSEFLETVSLTADIDKYDQADDAITLMTIHAAKGLEFPVVFVLGMEEGIFPHSRSIENQYDLEEERRLLYVGMTRAMQRLYLLFSKSRVMYGRIEICLPSRFISELPEEEIELIEI